MIECDVAVYGGTLAGVAAAIQVARMGKEAVLLTFNRHVGGMTSGGLTSTDLGNKDSIGGLAQEFYTRIGRARGFSPSKAESGFLKMLEEAGVKVLFERHLESAEIKNNRLISATMETGETIKAAVFIDATYEGDLLAAAHVSYRVGREAANTYGESLAGQWQKISMTDGPVQMRRGDSNNAGSFSSDYVGGNYRWPDGTYKSGSFSELPPPRRGLQMPFRKLYELRERIFQDHVNYQQGLMYFLANDKQVPEKLQKRVNRFGLEPDEF